MKKYYLTMGVGSRHETGMPYQNGHVLVFAETIQEARKKYAERYPHPKYPETVGNYAFDYTEENWKPVGGMDVLHDTIA